MQKVQPAKNSLDMDFLNSMNKPIGGSPVQQAAPVVTQAAAPVVEKEVERAIIYRKPILPISVLRHRNSLEFSQD